MLLLTLLLKNANVFVKFVFRMNVKIVVVPVKLYYATKLASKKPCSVFGTGDTLLMKKSITFSLRTKFPPHIFVRFSIS